MSFWRFSTKRMISLEISLRFFNLKCKCETYGCWLDTHYYVSLYLNKFLYWEVGQNCDVQPLTKNFESGTNAMSVIPRYGQFYWHIPKFLSFVFEGIAVGWTFYHYMGTETFDVFSSKFLYTTICILLLFLLSNPF